jgi:hypothetical protein
MIDLYDRFHVGRFVIYWDFMIRILDKKEEGILWYLPKIRKRNCAPAYRRIEWCSMNILIYKKIS